MPTPPGTEVRATLDVSKFGARDLQNGAPRPRIHESALT
jgi:hypothetical protein